MPRRDDLLRCPACKRGTLGASKSDFVCGACSRSYPLVDGYVDLLPPRAERPSRAQAAMESPRIVGIYESRLWRRSPIAHFLLGLPFDREAAIVRESLALESEHTLLDLACGPGIYTRSIARELPGGSVIGLDLSEPMLGYAAERAAEGGIDNVLWVRGDAMDLPLADGSIDRVSCCGALHLFPDMHHVLGEIHRVLAPSGRLGVAMVRRARGLIGAAATQTLHALGVTPFGEAELDRALGTAGFVDRKQHYAQRLWMIWSATKRVSKDHPWLRTEEPPAPRTRSST